MQQNGTNKSVPYDGAGEGKGVQTRFCTNIAQSSGMRNNMVYANVPNRDTAIDVSVGAVMRL